MESVHSDARRAVITRVAEGHWRAVADDREIGRGEASRRPDGRIFLSIDAWHGVAFDRLVEAMLAELPRPLHTMVDGTDHDSTARWERAGMAVRRREWLYQLPTTSRPEVVPPPAGVTLLPAGAADEGPLREAYAAIRAEIEAGVGWAAMPVQVPAQPAGAPMDPSRYAVAAGPDRYEGLVRVVARRRHARIGLVAVRADRRRRGIGRALLADVLAALHRGGIDTASADIDESNVAAMALFEGLGGRRAGSGLELVIR
ncbi:GNAT family N-acetyltransferase [Pseudonocardia eucalypti]|uniref:GNAT family N-acetyltransferase n=1 Tax=Pseudonocardia eucalypti TaxID=648755 RepID=A0ABP9PXP7_9PSEU|nr:ribosomal protein S18 acetylase RimI-like enzyme [Pseudonocardia eucalypti]